MLNIADLIAQDLQLRPGQVQTVIDLLSEGATVPFISRYRKEVTGAMDEVAVREIETLNKYYLELEKRKQYIISVIEAAGALTPELREKIEKLVDASELEDIYLPYRPKKRTRATVAIEHGLEPLAKIIMAQNNRYPEKAAERFINEDIPSVDEAIAGALDIIAAWINENPKVRSRIRNFTYRTGRLCARPAGKNKLKSNDKSDNFLNYHNFSRPLKHVESHQYLAICRGKALGVLNTNISVDVDEAIEIIEKIILSHNSTPKSVELIKKAIADSYKRLLSQSIESELMALHKEKSDKEAIRLFSNNLRQLLLAPPLGKARVLGVDPGFRTGCKIVCLDENGTLLHHDVIYPCPPKSERVTSARLINKLVATYDIDAIAIGNGTASRETEQFFRALHYGRDVKIFVVNESGASIYSASDLARKEFPNHDVTVRGAVSIGRRLLDPLAELVKIDPKSIGVGQYQHDVDQSALKDSLDFTVSSCVNLVGVNVNTASEQLLSYVSGIGPKLASNIIKYRDANGSFLTRNDIKNVPRMGDVAFQQSAGFLRIPESKTPLDNTAVHPESYHIVEAMASDLNVSVTDLQANSELIERIDIKKYINDRVGEPTLLDIIDELRRPGRDPRAEVKTLDFDPNITTIDDIEPGMILNGIITNITAFGAFVDLGIHDNGLLHTSKMSKENGLSTLKIGQFVKVRVIDVDYERCRISLSTKDN